VTLTFDLLTPKVVNRFMPFPVNHLRQFASFFSKYRVHSIGNGVDERASTDERTNREHFFNFVADKPGTHWQLSWIQHGRLRWKSTKSVLLWHAYTLLSWTFNFVADLLPVQQSWPCSIQLCCQCVPGL